MTEKEKAYCGDGIVRCMTMELGEGTKKFESNRMMTKLWCIHTGKKEKQWSKKMIHSIGTRFEAMIYDRFKQHGYEKTKLFLNELINKYSVTKEA